MAKGKGQGSIGRCVRKGKGGSEKKTGRMCLDAGAWSRTGSVPEKRAVTCEENIKKNGKLTMLNFGGEQKKKKRDVGEAARNVNDMTLPGEAKGVVSFSSLRMSKANEGQ